MRHLCLLLIGLMLALPAGGFAASPKDNTVLIPGGEFVRGSDHGDRDERPARRINLQPFRLDRCEVSNTDYAAYLNATCKNTEDGLSRHPEFGLTKQGGVYQPREGMAQLPMILVDWVDASRYCEWRGCKLPTEAQWEYACRAGGQGLRYSWGNSLDQAPSTLNRWWHHMPEPVGSHPPNPFGVFDLGGNVAEFVWDYYKPGFYAEADNNDPINERPGYEKLRVVRGGSISVPARLAYCARRSYVSERYHDKNTFTGFRCACAVQRKGAQ